MGLVTGSSELVGEIVEALGLGGLTNITRLSLDIVADEVVSVCLVKLVDSAELQRLAGLLGSKNIALAGGNNIKITGKMIEEEEPVDPDTELRELAALLRDSSKQPAAV